VSDRLVVLVSGAGTNLQALLDACADPAYGAKVVAVGADRPGIAGLTRAAEAGVPAFVQQISAHPSRPAWDEALTVVDMITFLGPQEAEVRAAAEWARETLTRLGAAPYLARLEAALQRQGDAAPIAEPAADSSARAEVVNG
jgi:hypothetical protein